MSYVTRGQQLAQQMQNSNPDLVDALRTQMRNVDNDGEEQEVQEQPEEQSGEDKEPEQQS